MTATPELPSLLDTSRILELLDQRYRDNKAARHMPRLNTPKAERRREPTRPSPAMTDAPRRLGHTPRGRKRSSR